MKKICQKILMIVMALSLFFSPFEPLFIRMVAASPTYIYLADVKETSVSVGYGTFKKNKNDSNEMISLIINGQRTYSMNALYAHATSNIIYDLTQYPDFDTFSSYVGVDASRGTLGNVKFYIYGCKEDKYSDKSWQLLKSSGVLLGNSEAEKLTVDLTGYKWLKLTANNNGDPSSDHAVYFDAMLYNSSKYDNSKTPTVDWIKTTKQYDEDLLEKTNDEILSNNKLKLELLQRTLVKRVGYSILQAYVNKNDRNAEFFTWLFNDEKRLEEYLLGGTPEGNNYLQSLVVFEELYNNFKSDLDDKDNGDTYRKMMMAISLAYGSDVNFWQTANTKYVQPERTPSDPIERYKVIKQLLTDGYTYDDVSTKFEKEVFKDLEIEEMRWVVNNRISDIEIAWLNWYTQKTAQGKTTYNSDGPKNPYTYIYYDSSFKWNYEDPKYYESESTNCASSSGNMHKSQDGYQRGANCNEKYGLKNFNIETSKDSPLRLWTIWEEDGVCGSLAGTGSNIEMAYGVPASLVSQPGHAAYFVSNIKEWHGQKLREWGIGNAAAGWARSYKYERMLLDWGSKTYDWVDTNNASYILVAQRALDNFADYKKAFMYNLIADVRTDKKDKIKAYEEAIKAQKYNVDAWYGLIQTILKDESITDDDYYRVAQAIIKDFTEFPLPMNDLLNLIKGNIVDNSIAYNKLYEATLNKLTTVTDKDYLQYVAIKDIAKYLLSIKEDTSIATFSFDGDDANILKLAGVAKEEKMAFEYTLNYEYDAQNQKVSDSTIWTKVTNGETEVDLSDRISEINEVNDIVVHLLVNDEDDVDNLFFINLEEGPRPEKIYQNVNERRIAGIDESIAEWIILDSDEKMMDFFMATSYNDFEWHKFRDGLPKFSDDGGDVIAVRNGYTGTYLPSSPMVLFTEAKEENLEFKYVPVDNQKVTTSSELETADASKLVDRGLYSYWHAAKDDKKAWIQIELKRTIQLSRLDYVPRNDNTVGVITKAKIEVSMDGEKWSVIEPELSWSENTNTKTYVPTSPIKAKYIRITSLESSYDTASAAMFNIYENTIKTTKDVNDLHVSYITNGYVYTGSEVKPVLTVKDEDKDLVENEHYTLEYVNNVKAGKGKVILKGLGIYDGEKEFEFEIAKAPAPLFTVAEGICADVTKKTLADIELPSGWSWKEPNTVLESGKTIKAIAVYFDTDNYENTEVEVTVAKEKGSHPTIKFTDDKKEYEFELDGTEQKTLEEFKKLVTITDVEDGNISLESDNVTITSDIDWTQVGTYHITIKVTDKDGNETIETLQISIVDKDAQPIELTDEEYEIVIENDELYYNGQTHNLDVKVRKKQTSPARISTLASNNETVVHELTLGTDYDIEFSELTKAGDHTLTITGKKIYSGTLTASYKINKAKQPTNMIHPEMKVSSDTTKLEQINLTEQWQWADESIELQEGENKVKIIFIGDENHERYETEVLVVREKVENVEPTPSEPEDENNETPQPQEQNKPTEPSVNENKTPSKDNNTNTIKPNVTVGTTTDKNDTTSNVEDETTEVNDDAEEVLDNGKGEQQETEEKVTENDKTTSKDEDKNSNNWIVIVIIVAFIALFGLIVLLVKVRNK